MTATLMLTLVLLASAASTSPKVGVKDWLELNDLYSRAYFEQGCGGTAAKIGQRRLDRHYRRELDRMNRWFVEKFGEAELNAAHQSYFGDDIMVGGCRVNRHGDALMPDEKAFQDFFRNFQHRYWQARRSGS